MSIRVDLNELSNALFVIFDNLVTLFLFFLDLDQNSEIRIRIQNQKVIEYGYKTLFNCMRLYLFYIFCTESTNQAVGHGDDPVLDNPGDRPVVLVC